MREKTNRFSAVLKPIKKLLFQALKGKVCPVIKGPLLGFCFEVNEATGLAGLISGGSSSERDTQRQIQKHCRNGSLAVDCGANWGLHTLLLSRLVGPSGKVISVEANPSICEILKKNININEILNVEISESALSNRIGSIRFNQGVGATTGRRAVAGAVIPAGRPATCTECLRFTDHMKTMVIAAVATSRKAWAGESEREGLV